MALNLYAGEPQYKNFANIDQIYPVSRMEAASSPFVFPVGTATSLPKTFQFLGEERDTSAFLASTDTSAVLVLKDGEIRTEEYYLTGGADVCWISWSVAKSFISALVGIAIDDGLINDVNDCITDYVHALKPSAYNDVSIRDVLQMSSGARWNEDYSDRSSDIHRLGRAMAGEQSLGGFVAGIEGGTTPGTFCQYNSADTQALGMLITSVTNRTIADYMQEKLCEPLGMEHSGHWIIDKSGMEMALGGLNLVARDFAKIGELYRNGGRWDNRQIVPEQWVKDSIKSDEAHLQPGKVIVGGHVFPCGYGYQWWIPDGSDGEFSAIGVYNQFVFVNPVCGTVVVKLSANRAYGTTTEEHSNREEETIEFIRAVVRELD